MFNRSISACRAFFTGLCVGAADLIPGISGGTVALILGVYEPLIQALRSFNQHFFKNFLVGKWKEAFRQVPIRFVGSLLLGMILAIAVLAQLVQKILSDPTARIFLYSLFFGLVLASTHLILRRVKQWKKNYIFVVALTGILAFWISAAKTQSQDSYEIPFSITESDLQLLHYINYNHEQQKLTHVSVETIQRLLAKQLILPSDQVIDTETKQAYSVQELVAALPRRLSFFNGWAFFCGMVGISVMLLPGISGSYILNLLGMYAPVMIALSDFTSGLLQFQIEWEAIKLLFSLGLGVLVGGALFARVVHRALRDYHDLTLVALVGFMLGALRSIWPFWTYVYALDPLHLARSPVLVPIQPLFPMIDQQQTWLAVTACFFGLTLILFLDFIVARQRLVPQ